MYADGTRDDWWLRGLDAFQDQLGHRFRKTELLVEALTHASFAHEAGVAFWNERLEYLGDAVLELTVSEILYDEFPRWNEGELTKERARIVCERTLAQWGMKMRIPHLLRLGRGLQRQGGRENPSICADASEAVFGAVFLDGEYAAAQQVIRRFLVVLRTLEVEETIDPKSKLQILFAERRITDYGYHLLGMSGPEHAPLFEVEVRAGGMSFGKGQGASRRDAEWNAARDTLRMLLRRSPQGPYSSVK